MRKEVGGHHQQLRQVHLRHHHPGGGRPDRRHGADGPFRRDHPPAGERRQPIHLATGSQFILRLGAHAIQVCTFQFHTREITIKL